MTKATPQKALPLAQRPLAEQEAWMRKQLDSVDQSFFIGMVQGTDGAAMAASQFRYLVKTLKREFPEKLWEAPSGKMIKGTSLPVSFTQVEHPKKNCVRVRGNLLYMGLQVCGEDAGLVRWMLASGFDPNAYSEMMGSAPIGFMAYTGKHQALRACRQAGIDLSLVLPPEHITGPDKSMAGSTLLHRVAQRFDQFPNQQAAMLVMHELLMAGLDPDQPTMQGQTVHDMAYGGAISILMDWSANGQARRLAEVTPKAKAPRSPKRL